MTSLALMMQLMLFSAVALGVVYFLFYQPTVGAQRRARRAVANLQVGDEVITTGGFYARVVDVSETEDGQVILGLELGGAVVKARISAVAELVQRAEPEPASTEPVTATATGQQAG